jgi:signal transduction histidine kinase
MPRTRPETSGHTILVVDDQPETLRATRRLLEREGHRVLLASDAREALDLFHRETVHLLIIDYFMPGMTGEELIAEIRRTSDTVQILLQTGYSGEKPARAMLESLDIQGYHDKTDGPDRLLLWVDVCLKAHRQLQRVREAERIKSEMLANVSHEFRTPLNISLGYVGMLIEGACGPLEPEAQELLGRVQQNTTSLLGLVTEMLDLATLETQAAELRFESVALRVLCEELASAVTEADATAQVRAAWDVSADGPLVRVDRAKLRAAFTQVCVHALAHAAGNPIEVQLDSSGTDAVVVRVVVPGGALAIEQVEALFEPLLQNRSTTGATGPPPVGIGLAMARRFVRQMGGDLTVSRETAPGPGFVLTLPVAAGLGADVRRAAVAG